MNDIKARIIAALVLRNEANEYGIDIEVNKDGTITFYHGTSRENAEKILVDGFQESTYFSHAEVTSGYGDEPPSWYATVKHKNGVVLRANIDCRYMDFVGGTGEFYLTTDYKPSVCAVVSSA